jgi:hypothetical protein
MLSLLEIALNNTKESKRLPQMNSVITLIIGITWIPFQVPFPPPHSGTCPTQLAAVFPNSAFHESPPSFTPQTVSLYISAIHPLKLRG